MRKHEAFRCFLGMTNKFVGESSGRVGCCGCSFETIRLKSAAEEQHPNIIIIIIVWIDINQGEFKGNYWKKGVAIGNSRFPYF